MKKCIYLIMVALLTGACSSIKVTSDYDRSADFSKYKTFMYYGWSDNSDEVLTGFDKERIESAFEDEFRKRGWTYTKEGGDAIVSLFIVVDKKTSYNTYTDHYRTGMYGGMYDPIFGYGAVAHYGPGYGSSHSTTVQRDYLVGTLIVDVFDAKTEKHIWQGIGKKTINENTKNREERIKNSVAEIMKAFPVQPMQ